MTQNLTIEPTLEQFRALAAEPGRGVISVRARLTADDVTPVGVYNHLCGTRDLTFLLESAEAGIWSRWSFIGVRCETALTSVDGHAEWIGERPAGIEDHADPLEALGSSLAALRSPREPGMPPLTSGFIGYLGYDVVRRLEKIGDDTVDDLRLPELCFMLVGDMAVVDHHRGDLWLISNEYRPASDPQQPDPAQVDAAWHRAVARIEQMAERLAEPRASLTEIDHGLADVAISRQRTPEQFAGMVDAAIEKIRDGEIFQVVPSQRFDIDTGADALDLYRQLRRRNPSPYLYLLRLPGFSVVGSSPEALVTLTDGVATTHPIAGTRPRGATAAADSALEAELLADEKERSEHTMLVDLGRNDLGRVCEPGTVNVTQFMHVGRYSHVMHLEASVTGIPRPDVSALDVTLSCFPAGTLSGAPKISAMRIIEKAETTRRGVYGGVVGYFDLAGNSDVAIAIRTAVLKDGVAHVQAGAGIVLDSVGLNENRECENKAAAVLDAVRGAEAWSRAHSTDADLAGDRTTHG
ncbi:MAG: chorismate-binding protein [Acidipropionibacterium acidipropionici]|jgi:anthranilate synthase component 1|uniref:Anthranilate synthase component 1 n=1 Tax=Acidipropionibacterium acidipropionici (strain ATCC 4875 / DSM 20272 / JCM 6432 / NBRC 12425 / NCIMB 8070 / 4) TaxID=1171373 RepID=K7S4T9_ACIA4|nr:chorismate-binding protein [Acidipropionibacterium acidipropionici]AFV89632.1 Anthranilate synthase component I [Acidipropionibacterium acidipropionici ATCC 4875]ALN15928.1 anthranilate synthase [Acidipropionibacterium acidipropionici]APZ08324.1 anthranilate synthase component I [Acidipropionibacterium acidipropionici]MDN6556665.1 chorismate-binding protein [Acidipropionibacterium acidipropionici]